MALPTGIAIPRDDNSQPYDFGAVQPFDLSFTSPNTATTATPVMNGAAGQAYISGLGGYRTFSCWAELQGATGGTLDVYLQYSPDGGSNWVDYAHFTQLAAAAGKIDRYFAVSKGWQQTTLTTVGTNNAPALAAGTVVGGDWGDRLRVVVVSGAGTTAGAQQIIKIIATS